MENRTPRKKICGRCGKEKWAFQTRNQPVGPPICIDCLGIRAGAEAAKVAKINKKTAKK